MFLCIISSSPGLANTPPVIISAAGRAGLPSNETSLASIASRAGYRTAAIGKVRSGLWVGKLKVSPQKISYIF